LSLMRWFVRPSKFAALSGLCITGLVIALVRCIGNLTHQSTPSAVQLHPWTTPVWDLGHLSIVKMATEDTVNYQLNGSTASAQWAALVPKHGGIVHIGPHRKPYMLSVFHQLTCLDILRRIYADNHEETFEPLGRHCLNYLRQTLLCRADLRLESVQDPDGPHAIDMWGDLTCTDWRQVYARVEENEAQMTGPIVPGIQSLQP